MKLSALILFYLISYNAIEPSNHQAIPAIKSCINGCTGALQWVSSTKLHAPCSLPHAIQPSNYPTTKAPKPHSSNTKLHAPRPLLPALNHSADSLPPINQLHHSIDSFYAAQTHWQLLEFKNSKKGEWLKFLPNIGITYTVSGQPRPSISLSSGLLYQAQKAKQTRAAKRRQIIETNRLEAEREKAKLQELLLRYELLKEELSNLRTLHRVDEQLFAIREDEYLRQERAPSGYLQAKRTFLLQQQALQDKEGQVRILELEILTTAHLK